MFATSTSFPFSLNSSHIGLFSVLHGKLSPDLPRFPLFHHLLPQHCFSQGIFTAISSAWNTLHMISTFLAFALQATESPPLCSLFKTNSLSNSLSPVILSLQYVYFLSPFVSLVLLFFCLSFHQIYKL